MKIKNILFIAPFDTKGRFKGGIASFASEIISDDTLLTFGIKLIPQTSCCIERKYSSGGILRFENFRNYFRLKKILKNKIKNNIDEIYINSSRNIALIKDLLLLKMCHKRNVKTIIHIHFATYDEVLHKNHILRNMTLNYLKKYADKIIVLSEKLKNDFADSGIDRDKIFVLRNYFSPNVYISESDIEKKAKEKITNYLFVGSLNKRKGIYDLIEVFNKLNNDYHLEVCGSPNTIEAKKLVDDCHKNNINFAGFVDGEKKDLVFKKSHVLVLPTYSEGLPITILEAMNYGLGIITTNVGAIPEILSENSALINMPGDIEALERSIKNYHCDNSLLCMHMKRNKELSTQFTYNSFKKILIGILKKEV